MLRRAIETDPLVASNDMPMVDSTGARSKLTLWNFAGNDTFGYFARGRRWVNAARRLIGSPIYHFHTKVMLKEPRVGGTWEWHQDFGYWYQVGCLEPDKMLSAILAVDNHTIENGCMQLLSGAHRLGRLAHGVSGEQAGGAAQVPQARLAPQRGARHHRGPDGGAAVGRDRVRARRVALPAAAAHRENRQRSGRAPRARGASNCSSPACRTGSAQPWSALRPPPESPAPRVRFRSALQGQMKQRREGGAGARAVAAVCLPRGLAARPAPGRATAQADLSRLLSGAGSTV